MILSKAANSYRAGTNDVIFVVVVSVRDNDSFLLHHVVFYLRRVTRKFHPKPHQIPEWNTISSSPFSC